MVEGALRNWTEGRVYKEAMKSAWRQGMRYVASADVLAGGPGLLALDSGALEKVHIRTITLI